MGQRALDSKDEHDGVDGPESKEQGVDADVKEGRRAGVICLIHLERIKREMSESMSKGYGRETYGFHAVCHEPVETFDEEEETKHEEEGHVELVTEDGEGEEGLCDEHPCLIVETLWGR